MHIFTFNELKGQGQSFLFLISENNKSQRRNTRTTNSPPLLTHGTQEERWQCTQEEQRASEGRKERYQRG